MSQPKTKPAATIQTSFIARRLHGRQSAPALSPEQRAIMAMRVKPGNDEERGTLPVLIEEIDDATDPRLADYRDLKDAALPLRQGVFSAESREVVRTLLATTPFRTRSVLLTPPGLDAMQAVLTAADPAIRVLLARQDLVRAIVGFNFHQGCVAVGERGAEPSIREVLDPPGPRLVLVLEDLTNPDNVGGVFRNALAFAAH